MKKYFWIFLSRLTTLSILALSLPLVYLVQLQFWLNKKTNEPLVLNRFMAMPFFKHDSETSTELFDPHNLDTRKVVHELASSLEELLNKNSIKDKAKQIN